MTRTQPNLAESHVVAINDLILDRDRPSREALIAARDFDGTLFRRAADFMLLAVLDPDVRQEARAGIFFCVKVTPGVYGVPICRIEAFNAERTARIPTSSALQDGIRDVAARYPAFHTDTQESAIFFVVPHDQLSAHDWLRLAIAHSALRDDLATAAASPVVRKTKWRRPRFSW